MNREQCRRILLLCAVFARLCPAIGVRNLRIEDLVKASDVIAVADVAEVKAVGPAAPLTFRGQQLPAVAYAAELIVRASIKGAIPSHMLVTYKLPTSFIGYQGLRPGTRLVFLRKEGTGYSLADPYYPDLPATAPESTAGFETGDYAAIVVHEMLAVVASSSTTSAQKYEILRVDYVIPTSNEAVAAFKRGLATAREPELTQRLQGELIRLGDISELPNIAQTLLNNLATDNQRVWLLYVIGHDLRNPHAIPALQLLLRSNDNSIREVAAEALWHINDHAAVSNLAMALEDPDELVRFYAVRGCSDIANELGWGGPSESEFHEHQEKYLTHWEDWVKSVGGSVPDLHHHD
jgi:HEAT repeats